MKSQKPTQPKKGLTVRTNIKAGAFLPSGGGILGY